MLRSKLLENSLNRESTNQGGRIRGIEVEESLASIQLGEDLLYLSISKTHYRKFQEVAVDHD